MLTLYYSRMQSPIGSLVVGVSDDGLAIIEFDKGEFPKGRLAQTAKWVESAERTAPSIKELREYFNGERREFEYHSIFAVRISRRNAGVRC